MIGGPVIVGDDDGDTAADETAVGETAGAGDAEGVDESGVAGPAEWPPDPPWHPEINTAATATSGKPRPRPRMTTKLLFSKWARQGSNL